MSRTVGGPAAALASLVLLASIVTDAPLRGEERSPTPLPERRLVQGFFDIRQGRIQNAMRNVSLLVEQRPDFRLAQLVYGDLLLSQAGRLSRFGHRAPQARSDELRAEARARLRRYQQSPPVDAMPAGLLQLPASLDSALVIDLEGYRLYVLVMLNMHTCLH